MLVRHIKCKNSCAGIIYVKAYSWGYGIVLYLQYTVEPPTTDSPYYGNLHNVDQKPWSRIIPYSLLYIATSI